MNPTTFPEANTHYGPPVDMVESQVATIPAFQGMIQGGSCDGTPITIVAWKPTKEELEELIKGNPIFLSMFGGLTPHYIGTNFNHMLNVA